MVKLLAALMVLAFSADARASMRGAPFQPEIDKRFSDLEEDVSENVGSARRQAKAVYDVAVDGGGSTSHALGVTIPAGSVITGVFVYINTAFVKAGGGSDVASLALQCAGTRDLMGYLNASAIAKDYALGISLTGDLRLESFATGSYIPESASNRFLQVPSTPTACELTVVVRGDSGFEPYSAGKATFIIEYFNKN